MPLYAVILAVPALAVPLLAAASVNPFDALHVMLNSAFGNSFAIGNTITDATPLLLPPLGVAVCFRARVYNIGGEGQLYMGALAGSAVAIYMKGVPPPLLIALVTIASALAGGVQALLTGAGEGVPGRPTRSSQRCC